MQCLDENTLLEIAQGKLASDEAAREVEAHLDSCATCRQLFVHFLRTSTRLQPAKEVPALARGALVGRYVIEDLLGAGGMGVVFRAYDPELDRKIALKLLRPSSVPSRDDEARARSLREAQAMARLSHPNVIAVYDAGVFQDQVFLAMELAAGGSLREWLSAGPRPWRQVLDAFLQAGRGLSAAHAAGLVHRDFKPDNVLLGSDGCWRVTDFGLARSIGVPEQRERSSAATGEPTTTPTLTQDGALLGTPAYMAPEQLEGRPATPSTDQFGFCVALYEALYGTRPFAGTDLRRLRAEHLSGRVQPPPGAARVPLRVRRALLRGLSQDERARHPSMDHLLCALAIDRAARRRLISLGGVFVLLTGAWSLQHISQDPPCRATRQPLAGIWDEAQSRTAHQAFAATGLPYAESAWGAVDAAFRRQAGALVAMRTEACEASRLRGEQSEEVLDLRNACLDRRERELGALARLFWKAEPGTVENAVQAVGALTGLRGCADVEALRAVVKPPEDPVIRGRVETLRTSAAQAKALYDAGSWRGARDAAQELVRAAGELGYRPLEADSLLLLGRAQSELGDYEAAVQSLLRAALAAEAGQHDEAKVRAYVKLAEVTGYRQRSAEKGTQWSEQAAAVIEHLPHSDEVKGELALVRARIAVFVGLKLQQGLDDAQEGLRLLNASLGPDHPRVAEARGLVGTILTYVGNLDQALPFQEEALAARTRLLGSNHPETVKSLSNLANLLATRGDFARAAELNDRALALRIDSLGPEHPMTTWNLVLKGEILHQQGGGDEAAKVMREALRVQEKVLGPDHQRVASTLAALGRILLEDGRYDEARAAFERSIAIDLKAAGPTSSMLGAPLAGLGELHLRQGRWKQARDALERCLGLVADKAYPSVAGPARFALARTLWASSPGERGRALELAREALGDLRRAGSLVWPRAAEVEEWIASHSSDSRAP
ncbi:MAG: serine/threonine protein kinase [Deltaproteobacteria bacterium]|nr:serine/threonine protein kinase [Deltaproteobacteria bacterium]